VENAVGGHLCNGLNSVKYSVTYWRERNHEVDFVVARGDKLWAIEVKSGRRGKASGLSSFRNSYHAAIPLLVGGQCIPLADFFSRDAHYWLV